MNTNLSGWENQSNIFLEDLYTQDNKLVNTLKQAEKSIHQVSINIPKNSNQKSHIVPKIIFKNTNKKLHKKKFKVLNMTQFCKNISFTKSIPKIKKSQNQNIQSKQNIYDKDQKNYKNVNQIKEKKETKEAKQAKETKSIPKQKTFPQTKISVINVFEKIALKQKPSNHRMNQVRKKIINFYRSKQKRIKSQTSHIFDKYNQYIYNPKIIETPKQRYSVPPNILYNLLSCESTKNSTFYQRFPVIRNYQKCSSQHVKNKNYH